jgi:radical SAM protein with 4Fe4S-binding SPASM domain
MYRVEQLETEAGALRAAVQQAQPFRPLMVKIKLLWACNLACGMCDYWRQPRPSALTPEIVAALLDDLAALGCRKVHFSGGEPVLRPDLPEIVAHARRLKLRVTLTTNGTLLTRGLSRRLVKAGLNGLCVSIDSPVRAVHDRLRGMPGALKATLAGVSHLRAAAEERGSALAIRVNTVVSRESYATLDRLPALLHEIGACSLLLLPVDDPSGDLLLNKRRLQDYHERIAPALAEQGLALGLLHHAREAYPFGVTRDEWADSRDGRYARGLYERQPCYAPWTHALVAADGHVAPCCSAPRVTLGNLTEARFPEIWQGEAYRALRERMRDGRPLKHCAGCDVFLAENRALHRIVALRDERVDENG